MTASLKQFISIEIMMNLKRGRGSQRQTTVLVMAESKDVELTQLNKNLRIKRSLASLK
jgi:hypothetical protein